jgi:hypothetical protein
MPLSNHSRTPHVANLIGLYDSIRFVSQLKWPNNFWKWSTLINFTRGVDLTGIHKQHVSFKFVEDNCHHKMHLYNESIRCIITFAVTLIMVFSDNGTFALIAYYHVHIAVLIMWRNSLIVYQHFKLNVMICCVSHIV